MRLKIITVQILLYYIAFILSFLWCLLLLSIVFSPIALWLVEQRITLFTPFEWAGDTGFDYQQKLWEKKYDKEELK